MPPLVEITTRSSKMGNSSSHFGGSKLVGNAVAKGTCSFCNREVGFRQVGTYENSDTIGFAVSVRCDNCHAIMTIGVAEDDVSLYPTPSVGGVTDVPKGVDRYYQEALDCLSARAPNGATTLFRKTIHAIAKHYGIAEVDDSTGIYQMVNNLHEEGHINEKLRRSLLAVKDLGNDGAHINENEPDMEQAMAIKDLIDAVLSATVIADQRIEYARENHPNEFAEAESDDQ